MSSPREPTSTELPAVDERLVAGETRYEIDDGKLVYVAPADEPHAVHHGALGALLRAHRAPDRSVAIDMLTRTSRTSDLAPDASIFPTARDPRTGGRQIEELAFELLATSRLADAAARARKLVGRGVRRVFASDVRRKRCREWSVVLGTWSMLGPDAVIEDVALAVPLPVLALADAAAADLATVRAYRAQRHPEFLAEREAGRREVLLALVAQKLGALDEPTRKRLDEVSTDELAARVLTATSLDELLA
jgi:Uma2 family endonuclease